jgi:spore coat protein U-like protein
MQGDAMNARRTVAMGDHARPQRERRESKWPIPGLRLCACVLAFCGLAPVLPALAASGTDCRVDTSSAQIAFGTYDPLSALPLDATGTINVVCDKNNVAIRVELDRGGGGSYLPRQLRSGTQSLAYNLYVDSTRSIVFGNGGGGTQAGAGTTSAIGGAEFRAQVPVYGRIAPGLDAGFGNYSDSISVSVTF